jgi:uncharacterized SAM-binding protein YcdF (DUF218 family)
MNRRPDDKSQKPPIAAPRHWLRATIVGVLAFVFVGAAIGFIGFLSQLRGTEIKPDHNADGIVVLTGGDSRVSDGLGLLAAGRARRLLISGVYAGTTASDIARQVVDYNRMLTCCVDLDYSAINTASNATGTRQWTLKNGFHSLIVVTSAYHMPRALAELSHQMPGVALIPYPVVSDRLRIDPWWSNSATTKLVLSEYFKYLAAKLRMQFEPAPASS